MAALHVVAPRPPAAAFAAAAPQRRAGAAAAPHRARSGRMPQLRTRAGSLRPGESPEVTLERRRRESERVDERVTHLASKEELDQEMAKAGEKLVVVEVVSDELCQTGWQEAELQWKEDQEAALAPCRELKHTFQRTARDCPDVVFLTLEVDGEGGSELQQALGVEVLPTLQFWRRGQKLWEHRGVAQLDQDLGEGVLYYGDQAANNERASTWVSELRSRADFDAFLAAQDEKVLTVVDISLTSAAPCVHIFPAVMALARSFVGYAAFARLLGDQSPELEGLMGELNVKEVPTFLFFRNGKEVGRHVGSSRGDLIGKILEAQGQLGIAPPPPPGGQKRRTQAAARR